MSIIDTVQNASNRAIKNGEEYVEATQDYFELKIFQQIALTFSLFVKILLIGGLLFIALTLVLIAGILKLGELLGSFNSALLYTSLGLVIFSSIIYVFRKKLLDNQVIKKLSKSFFQKLVD